MQTFLHLFQWTHPHSFESAEQPFIEKKEKPRHTKNPFACMEAHDLYQDIQFRILNLSFILWFKNEFCQTDSTME